MTQAGNVSILVEINGLDVIIGADIQGAIGIQGHVGFGPGTGVTVPGDAQSVGVSNLYPGNVVVAVVVLPALTLFDQ